MTPGSTVPSTIRGLPNAMGEDLALASRAHLAIPKQAASQPFKLAVAAHFVFAGRVGGAEHMLYNLLRGFWSHGVALDVHCAHPENFDPGFLQEMHDAPRTRVIDTSHSGSRFWTEQRSLLDRANAADAVLFPNYYVPPIVPRRFGAIVCVLHDMQYRHFRANFSQRKRLWLRYAHNAAIRHCDHMITLSEFVREDAIRFLGERFANRISVVSNPISWQRFGKPDTVPLSQRRPCIVSVAAQYEHKNLPTLIRAFAIVLQRWPEARLVLIGQDYRNLVGVSGSTGGLMGLAASLGISRNVEITGYVNDARLGQLLAEATVFAFPSIFEGFGMPAVEALGLGLPTLTTRRTALLEVTLGLADYVDDAESPGEWAERLDTMLADPGRYAPSEGDIATVRARYSPSRIAGQYLDVLRTAGRS